MRKYIPDCFWPETAQGVYVSHEAICLLNAGTEDVTARLILYFEDREKMGPFEIRVPAERTLHVRMDKLLDECGNHIPRAKPYAAVVESDAELAVQYTRVDTTQNNLGLMTTMA